MTFSFNIVSDEQVVTEAGNNDTYSVGSVILTAGAVCEEEMEQKNIFYTPKYWFLARVFLGINCA